LTGWVVMSGGYMFGTAERSFSFKIGLVLLV
jgi:hypothetical protein